MQTEYGLINFSPKGKTFSFNFTKDTCHFMLAGKCALESFKEQLNLPPVMRRDEEINSCVYLYKHVIKNKIKLERFPITIIKCKCGHYTFNDGQHRTCLAGRLNLDIQAEYYEDDEILCDHCCGHESGFLITF